MMPEREARFGMNVVVFTAYTQWPLHYETDLEIIQRHLDAGDSVTHLYCTGSLLACDDNGFHLPERCNDCISVRQQGSALLSPGVRSASFLSLSAADRRAMVALPKRFDSIESLRACRVDNFDIGWAVLSSVISWTRDPKPDINAIRNLIPRFMISAFSVYRSMQNYLAAHQTDRVYVFNGRFAHARAVLRACQKLNVACHTHERGNNLQHYGIWENTMPHDIRYADREIRRKWKEAEGDPDRTEIAERFYRDRSKGIVQSWYSFITSQEAGRLPAGWDPAKRNIAIFNSSEDEFEALGDDYVSRVYRTQQEGLERILASISADPSNIHLYLRVHPNLKGQDNHQTRQLATLKADFLTILQPDDAVSSYTLMKQAKTVLTFGSTVGIESVYWGTPSILAGPAFYEDLGATYNPSSHEELMTMLRADLPPKDRTPALMFGYYYNTFGIRFKYYEPLSMMKGEFKGHELRPEPARWRWLERATWRHSVVRFCRYTLFTVRSRLRVLHSVVLR
jgi:hypothetical protein